MPRAFPSFSSRRGNFYAFVAGGAVLLWILGSSPARSSATGDSVPRYTDEDLKPRRRAAAGAAENSAASPQTQPQSRPGPAREQATSGSRQDPPPAPRTDSDWVRQWKHDQERRQYWERKIAEAQERIRALEERLAYLGRKKASVQNPFLPRPPLSEEDRQAEAGMDGGARLGRVEGQISDTRRKLEEAKEALVELRALAGRAMRAANPLPTSAQQSEK
ncbi:MAG: hypothetical protein V3U98_02115 [Acidobacteriota bacterium]